MTNSPKTCEVCGEPAFTELSEETMEKVGMCGTCTFGEADANIPDS